MGEKFKMKKRNTKLDLLTLDQLNSVYWKIRKNYPLTSWITPKNEFEKIMQDVLYDFGEILRNLNREAGKYI